MMTDIKFVQTALQDCATGQNLIPQCLGLESQYFLLEPVKLICSICYHFLAAKHLKHCFDIQTRYHDQHSWTLLASKSFKSTTTKMISNFFRDLGSGFIQKFWKSELLSLANRPFPSLLMYLRLELIIPPACKALLQLINLR